MVEKIKYELTAFLGTTGREVGHHRHEAGGCGYLMLIGSFRAPLGARWVGVSAATRGALAPGHHWVRREAGLVRLGAGWPPCYCGPAPTHLPPSTTHRCNQLTHCCPQPIASFDSRQAEAANMLIASAAELLGEAERLAAEEAAKPAEEREADKAKAKEEAAKAKAANGAADEPPSGLEHVAGEAQVGSGMVAVGWRAMCRAIAGARAHACSALCSHLSTPAVPTPHLSSTQLWRRARRRRRKRA